MAVWHIAAPLGLGAKNGTSRADAFATILDVIPVYATGDQIYLHKTGIDTLTADFNPALAGVNTNFSIISSRAADSDAYEGGAVVDGNNTVSTALNCNYPHWGVRGVHVKNVLSDGIYVGQYGFVEDCFVENAASVGIRGGANSTCNNSTVKSSLNGISGILTVNQCFCSNINRYGINTGNGGTVSCCALFDCGLQGGYSAIFTGSFYGFVRGCAIHNTSKAGTIGINAGGIAKVHGCAFSNLATAISAGTYGGSLVSENLFYNVDTKYAGTQSAYTVISEKTATVSPFVDADNEDLSVSSSSEQLSVPQKIGATWNAAQLTTNYITAGLNPAQFGGSSGPLIPFTRMIGA